MRLGLDLAWVSFCLPPVAASTFVSRLCPKAELEFLLYDQFRRNVSSAVALARFIVVFATHLNLDFTEFNFAVRMTLPACICVCVCISMSVCVCVSLNFCVMNAICCCLPFSPFLLSLCVCVCVCEWKIETTCNGTANFFWAKARRTLVTLLFTHSKDLDVTQTLYNLFLLSANECNLHTVSQINNVTHFL